MKFTIMTAEHGHSVEAFNKDDVVSQDAARARFAELTEGGKFSAFNTSGDPGTPAPRMKEFDPAAEEVTFHRPLQGG